MNIQKVNKELEEKKIQHENSMKIKSNEYEEKMHNLKSSHKQLIKKW